MTAGFDGSIHLYHSLKQQHLLEVVPTEGPLHAVQWSPFRPLVFAAAAGESQPHRRAAARGAVVALQAAGLCGGSR